MPDSCRHGRACTKTASRQLPMTGKEGPPTHATSTEPRCGRLTLDRLVVGVQDMKFHDAQVQNGMPGCQPPKERSDAGGVGKKTQNRHACGLQSSSTECKLGRRMGFA